ncbi:MAG: hypothetical protein Q7O66_23830 [Dehalococcoidia bacterium]|nr:hypothetical protein [Dehalococcoidia bacterium]
MSETKLIVLSPTGRRKESVLRLSNRPEDLRGKTVGLVYNGEWWMEELLLQRYETLLKERCGVGDVIYLSQKKENMFQKKARSPRAAWSLAEEVIEDMAQKCDVVFVALGN